MRWWRLQDAKEEPFVPEELKKQPAWARLEDQLGWYDKKSGEKQQRYKQIKAAQLVLAGAIPIFSLVASAWAG